MYPLSPSLRTSLNASHYHHHGSRLQGPMEITRLSEELCRLEKRPRAPCPPLAPRPSNPARSADTELPLSFAARPLILPQS